MWQIFFLFLGTLQAAPFPATSTSAFNAAPPYYKSDLGFEIPRNDTGWAMIHPDGTDPYFLITYKPVFSAPESLSQMSVRVDPLKDRSVEEGKITLKSYVDYWSKQYPKLGIDILQIQFSKRLGRDLAVIDSRNSNTKIQMRQFVLWNKENAVLFTCSDKQNEFNVSLGTCQEIFSSVKW